MGVLLPNGNDIEVINQLNAQFSITGFRNIKTYMNGANDHFLWGNGKTLKRASYRLNIWPTSDNRSRARWFAFLNPGKRILSQQNHDDIQRAFQTAYQDNSVVGMLFWAQFDANVPPNTYAVQTTRVPADNAGHFFVKVTLLCDHEIGPGENGDPDPGPDQGETGPIHPVHRRRLRRRSRAAKKTAAKKTAVKKAKKVSKAKKAKKAKKKR